jgi:hypothetical protein
MTKEQVYNYILVNTNQYFVGSENFEINPDVLDGLIWKALNIWGEYYPIYVIAPVALTSTKLQLSQLQDSHGIIRYIRGVTDIFFDDYTKVYFEGARDAYKVQFQWRYDDVRNVLMTPINDGTIYYIEALCTPVLEDVNPTETLFLELMVGLSLVYIGHNRTDFALSELPFDIRDLRDEGQQIIDRVKEELEKGDDSSWTYAIDLLV